VHVQVDEPRHAGLRAQVDHGRIRGRFESGCHARDAIAVDDDGALLEDLERARVDQAAALHRRDRTVGGERHEE